MAYLIYLLILAIFLMVFTIISLIFLKNSERLAYNNKSSAEEYPISADSYSDRKIHICKKCEKVLSGEDEYQNLKGYCYDCFKKRSNLKVAGSLICILILAVLFFVPPITKYIHDIGEVKNYLKGAYSETFKKVKFELSQKTYRGNMSCDGSGFPLPGEDGTIHYYSAYSPEHDITFYIKYTKWRFPYEIIEFEDTYYAFIDAKKQIPEVKEIINDSLGDSVEKYDICEVYNRADYINEYGKKFENAFAPNFNLYVYIYISTDFDETQRNNLEQMFEEMKTLSESIYVVMSYKDKTFNHRFEKYELPSQKLQSS